MSPPFEKREGWGSLSWVVQWEMRKKRWASQPIGKDAKLPSQLGEVIDTILANQKIYNQGGKPMGPGNQGGNIVNGVTLTPKASVPR